MKLSSKNSTNPGVVTSLTGTVHLHIKGEEPVVLTEGMSVSPEGQIVLADEASVRVFHNGKFIVFDQPGKQDLEVLSENSEGLLRGFVHYFDDALQAVAKERGISRDKDSGGSGSIGWGRDKDSGGSGSIGWGRDKDSGGSGSIGWGRDKDSGGSGSIGWGRDKDSGGSGSIGWGRDKDSGGSGSIGWGRDKDSGGSGSIGWGRDKDSGGSGSIGWGKITDEVKGVSPKESLVSDTRTIFLWTRAEGEHEYIFRLFNKEDDQPILEEKGKNVALIEVDLSELDTTEGDSLHWQVQVGEESTSPKFGFEISDGKKKEKVLDKLSGEAVYQEAVDPEQLVMQAVALDRAELTHDAMTTLAAALAKYPDNQFVQQMTESYYDYLLYKS